MMGTVKFNKKKMETASAGNYSLATDIADYLVKKGLPFREAHKIVGKLVKYALRMRKGFSGLNIADYQKLSSLFDEDVLAITAKMSVEARNITGGTAPRQVSAAVKRAQKLVCK
jgi:argininosuccinate lyase